MIGSRRTAVLAFTCALAVGVALPAWAADPTLLWNTFLGATGDDNARGVVVDGGGSVFVVGLSAASWGDSPVSPHSGGSRDAFVAKLDTNGVLLWNTFLGSSGFDQGLGISLDGGGNVLVAGGSASSWGSPVRAHQGGASDAFVAKLDPDGVLLWNTFLGGAGDDVALGVAVDGAGNPHVVGRSFTTWGDDPVSPHSAGADVFVARLDGDGALQWHTFLGGTSDDFGNGIATDSSGNSFIVGRSAGTWGSPERTHFGAGHDAFAARLDAGGALVWNTFLGDSGVDNGSAVALGGGGSVLVAGDSVSSWGDDPVQDHSGAFNDGFAARLEAATGALLWNTFLGGAGFDEALGVALDGGGNVYLSGYSSISWGSPLIGHSESGNDAFAAQLDGDGALQWHTFLGGTGGDISNDLAVDDDGNVYLVGLSSATWGDPLRAYTAALDAFVAKLGSAQAPEGPDSIVSILEIPTVEGLGLALMALLLACAALAASGLRART